MVSPRTMKQKSRVMFLTLIGAALLGLAVGLLPLDNNSVNASPKGKPGGQGGPGGKDVPTANVDMFKVQETCSFLTIWTHWKDINPKKIGTVDIVLMKDDRTWELSPDPGHNLYLGTAVFRPDTSILGAIVSGTTYEVTETRFYDKRGKILETFITGGTPPLTGNTSLMVRCG